MSYLQVDALEYDALQVLSMVRSARNAFAPVNRTPPEVLSLIPDYWEDYEKDRNSIVLTHVCRSWREIFVSRPSLWTYLDFDNVEKTRVYIERSKCAPLEIHLEPPYEEAFFLRIPHIRRLKTLSVCGGPDELLPVLVKHFSCPLPLLDDLTIDFRGHRPPTLPENLFDGDLSSLCKLTLGTTIPLPWRDLSNLTTFNLYEVPEDKILLTQLLDFFESAPYLRHIQLHYSLPSFSNAPTERVVPLPHLEDLSIKADQPDLILLDHLSIPAGASLHLKFGFDNENSPISSYLPKSLGCLRNLSHITAVNLFFGWDNVGIQLSGPSGMLHIFGEWNYHKDQPNAGTSLITQFLSKPDISRTRWLTITFCKYWLYDPARITKSTLYRTLHRIEDLRTLTLIGCEDLPFIHALNPNKNPDKIVLCPRLEEIILYVDELDTFHADELVNMVEGRATRGAKLPAITINIDEVPPEEEVSRLKKHVSRVEYRFDDVLPEWDALPG